MNRLKVIAIDADDTLWENEPLFRATEAVWAEELKEYGSKDELISRLYNIEVGNLPFYGYGVVAFMANLVEAALEISGRQVSGESIDRIVKAARGILNNPATPLPGVEETLKALHESGRYKLVLFTKGELLTQKTKVFRSGLKKYFDAIEIDTNKSHKEYLELIDKYGVKPCEFAMVGNSFKSDIAPALEVGGWGFYVPAIEVWIHEIANEYPHERLRRLESFSDLTKYLL